MATRYTVYGQPTRLPIAFTGIALHASALAFVHPKTGTRLDFSSPLPPGSSACSDIFGRGTLFASLSPIAAQILEEGYAMSELTVVILAAGEGKRMRSSLPKVLHRLCGRPLVAYPLRAARAVTDRVVMVVGHQLR